MRKNIAGQKVGAQLVSASDGTAFTGAVTVYVTIDAATQAIGTVGSGAATHEGNGYHTYNPSQAETNGTLIAFTFVGTGAIPVTVQFVAADETADAVYDEPYAGHDINNTYGQLWDRWRKANPAVAGEVTAAITPTTTQFSTDITGYTNDTFKHSILLFVDGATYADHNSPISGYVSSNGVVTLEVPLPAAPTVGDQFVIQPGTHVHLISEIVSGVWSALTSGLSVVGSTGRALARLIGLVENSSGDRFTAKALEQAPAGGGGGDASQATLLAVKAKTDLITSQTANQQQTPVNQITITRGDSYSGSTKITRAVTTDYTGYTATFTIRHRITNAVLLTKAATVESSAQLSVALTTTDTAFALLVDATEFGPHPYDFRLVSGAIEKTEPGIAIIKRDVTT